MNRVIIKGEFRTGTTIADTEEAKIHVVKLLKEKLAEASCLKNNDVFSFEIESIHAEKM